MKRFKLIAILFTLYSCAQNKNIMPKHTNSLINETSPYLLQHAHNPVDWYAWNNKTLELAKKNNSLILISVGYAACHWCHVMEHESFENEAVAKVMNANFVNIKVDREERPDVDQVYMNAVQLMTGHGGWPMNVIALPDGRPIWGGTYFKKEQWINALSQIAALHQNQPQNLIEYATKLEQGLKAMDLIKVNTEAPEFNNSYIDNTVKQWSTNFDYYKGGIGQAPKFMMPNNYEFLLRYGHQNNDKDVLSFVDITLTKMAYGGLYDQIGGGFSRYSVDDKWHVPHFEKMLYDNGQLVSLYANAFARTKNTLYKEVIEETLRFITRELTDASGGFYSSLDADSLTETGELEEGAFYVWTKQELKTILTTDFDLFSKYYNVNGYGYWEHKNYVLIRNESDANFIENENISLETLETKKQQWKSTLLKEREKRERPRLDDKILTSWNALMLKGYIDAYKVLKDEAYLKTALKNANFIINNQLKENGSLYHNYKNGKASIQGFLEDYAISIDSFISLYEVTLDEKWLNIARDLTNYTFDAFYDETSQLFQFTSNKEDALIVNTFEYRDNVIPASNSVMAKNLYKLSHYFDNEHYGKTATNMLNNVKPEISKYGSAFSNWMDLMLNYTQAFYEIAIVGEDAMSKTNEINTQYIPNKIIIGSKTDNTLPLLKNRFVKGETLIYVCENKTCKRPTNSTKEALNLIKR